MKRVVLLVFVTATWAVAPSLAAQAGSGLYLGGELGVNLAQGLDIGGSSKRPGQCVR